MAGSALLRDESRVARILEAVVTAVSVPVTLKIRTGWNKSHRTALTIARLAEAAGIQALTIHGRTRACMFQGEAEYETIAAVKAAIGIPVIANGDIDTPEKARAVLDATGADGLMIGRAALGQPWIFREILSYLATGQHLPSPGAAEQRAAVDHFLAGLEHSPRLDSRSGELAA
jgi:tRNA-dihydrouridine synthase B